MENQNLWGLTKLEDLNLKAELMPPFYFLPLAHKTLFSNMSASFGGQWSEIESGTSKRRNLDICESALSSWCATLWKGLPESRGVLMTIHQCSLADHWVPSHSVYQVLHIKSQNKPYSALLKPTRSKMLHLNPFCPCFFALLMQPCLNECLYWPG